MNKGVTNIVTAVPENILKKKWDYIHFSTT